MLHAPGGQTWSPFRIRISIDYHFPVTGATLHSTVKMEDYIKGQYKNTIRCLLVEMIKWKQRPLEERIIKRNPHYPDFFQRLYPDGDLLWDILWDNDLVIPPLWAMPPKMRAAYMAIRPTVTWENQKEIEYLFLEIWDEIDRGVSPNMFCVSTVDVFGVKGMVGAPYGKERNDVSHG
ncbi:hypothetical protein S40288_10944 [Stachybotrys chartarum IBT 40288]|nr:hypothetical protein S40288_10944 [Stachybotrys chartarum IBT 40288]